MPPRTQGESIFGRGVDELTPTVRLEGASDMYGAPKGAFPNRLRTVVRTHLVHANASIGQWRALRVSASYHGAPPSLG